MSEIGHFRFSKPAAADLSGSQFLFVWHDGNGQFALSGAGERGYVLQNKPAAGEAAEVKKVGLTECVSGAAVTAGADVASDASGKGVDATTGARINGTAVTGTSGADERFTLDPSNAGGVAP